MKQAYTSSSRDLIGHLCSFDPQLRCLKMLPKYLIYNDAYFYFSVTCYLVRESDDTADPNHH